MAGAEDAASTFKELESTEQLTVELSVRRLAARVKGKVVRRVCFGDGGTNKKQLEVTQLKIFVFGSNRIDND